MESPTGQVPGGAYGPSGTGVNVLAAPPGKIRPGRIWYLPALLAFAAGFAWLIFGLVSLNGQVDGFQRVPLPAGGTVSLGHTGGYTMYYEAPGANHRNASIPRFEVQVIPASPGASVASLAPYGGSVTYGFGSHQGRAVLSLRVAHPGAFRVQITNGPATGSASGLAVGGSITGGIVKLVLVTLALVFAGAGAAIVIFCVRMAKSRRRRAALSAG